MCPFKSLDTFKPGACVAPALGPTTIRAVPGGVGAQDDADQASPAGLNPCRLEARCKAPGLELSLLSLPAGKQEGGFPAERSSATRSWGFLPAGWGFLSAHLDPAAPRAGNTAPAPGCPGVMTPRLPYPGARGGRCWSHSLGRRPRPRPWAHARRQEGWWLLTTEPASGGDGDAGRRAEEAPQPGAPHGGGRCAQPDRTGGEGGRVPLLRASRAPGGNGGGNGRRRPPRLRSILVVGPGDLLFRGREERVEAAGCSLGLQDAPGLSPAGRPQVRARERGVEEPGALPSPWGWGAG